MEAFLGGGGPLAAHTRRRTRQTSRRVLNVRSAPTIAFQGSDRQAAHQSVRLALAWDSFRVRGRFRGVLRELRPCRQCTDTLRESQYCPSNPGLRRPMAGTEQHFGSFGQPQSSDHASVALAIAQISADPPVAD
jgi:hypothetical protein